MKLDRLRLLAIRARSEAALDLSQRTIETPFPGIRLLVGLGQRYSANTNLFNLMLSHNAHNQIRFLAPHRGISSIPPEPSLPLEEASAGLLTHSPEAMKFKASGTATNAVSQCAQQFGEEVRVYPRPRARSKDKLSCIDTI